MDEYSSDEHGCNNSPLVKSETSTSKNNVDPCLEKVILSTLDRFSFSKLQTTPFRIDVSHNTIFCSLCDKFVNGQIMSNIHFK